MAGGPVSFGRSHLQGKIEMMKAPRTFGGLFEDTDALDDSKVLVSQEPSELYVLDELSIHDLQRVYGNFDIILDHFSRISLLQCDHTRTG